MLLAAHPAPAQVLVADPDPIAFGIPTVHIYVDGPLGGTLDWNNTGVETPMPAGACGFRIDGPNMLEWAWYEGGIYGTSVMAIQHNGQALPEEPGAWIEFTGPYGPGCGNEYVVYTPASLNGVVPNNAVKLVLQFLDWDDIVFLDAGMMPLPPVPPGDPDPDPPDPCHIVEFCEGPRDFVNCFLDFDFNSHCDEDAATLDLSLTGLDATRGLRALAASFAGTTVKVSPNTAIALKAALQRVDRARAQQDRLLRSVASHGVSRDQARLLGRIDTSLQFAQAKVAACSAASQAAQRSRKPGADGSAKRAAVACARAADNTLDVHEASMLLTKSFAAPRRQ